MTPQPALPYSPQVGIGSGIEPPCWGQRWERGAHRKLTSALGSKGIQSVQEGGRRAQYAPADLEDQGILQ